MEELVNSITEIEKVLENDTLDILLSIITGVVPIFLTILSILLSKKMNRQNEIIQEMLMIFIQVSKLLTRKLR